MLDRIQSLNYTHTNDYIVGGILIALIYVR